VNRKQSSIDEFTPSILLVTAKKLNSLQHRSN